MRNNETVKPRRISIEKVLPGDSDLKIVQARRREPLANFEAYHRKRQRSPRPRRGGGSG